MSLRNLIFQAEVVEQRFRAVVLPHHDQQASDDRNQTEHGRMLSSNMLLLNLILLIEVTFSTPTPGYNKLTHSSHEFQLARGQDCSPMHRGWCQVSWFRSRSSRPPQQLMARIIKFVGEQDGSSERDLK